MKNQNRRTLSTDNEKAEAFKITLQRTFQTSEEDNENFDYWREEMVEAWHLVYRDWLVPKEVVHITNEDVIPPVTFKNVIK